MYKLIKSIVTQKTNMVLHTESNTFIPFDPDNTDYQQYLKWVAQGNEPLPADEGVA
jgi:microcystin degradation protein MlrC